jgi:hypothetical protein
MLFLSKAPRVVWTRHARAKMAFYGLSEQRVLRVIHTPRRAEEGIAPKTIAVMQPVAVRMPRTEICSKKDPRRGGSSLRGTSARFGSAVPGIEQGPRPKEIWSQEIWVMIQDLGKQRKIVSAWRYPGMTRPRGEVALDAIRREYREFLKGKE